MDCIALRHTHTQLLSGRHPHVPTFEPCPFLIPCCESSDGCLGEGRSRAARLENERGSFGKWPHVVVHGVLADAQPSGNLFLGESVQQPLQDTRLGGKVLVSTSDHPPADRICPSPEPSRARFHTPGWLRREKTRSQNAMSGPQQPRGPRESALRPGTSRSDCRDRSP